MDPDAGPIHLDDGDDLDAFVADTDGRSWSSTGRGCSTCRAVEPVLGKVARATEVAVGLVNPGDDVDLVERFDVRSVPTPVLFRDGEAVARRAAGFQGAEAVVEFLEEHVPGVAEPVG